MAKRQTSAKKTARATTDETQEAMNARLADMAEQLGRMAGRVAARADTLPSQVELGRQLVSVRDGATRLLEQLRGQAMSAVASARSAMPGARTGRKTAKAAKTTAKARSGGVVDAPGKKHRTPPPASLGKGAAAGQSARRLAATPRSKAPNRRGRG